MLIERFVNSIHLFHRMDVIHGDLHPDNVLIPVESPDCFAFVNFALSEAAQVPSPGHLCSQCELPRVWSCMQEIEDPVVGSDWIFDQIRIGPQWTEMLGEANGMDMDSHFLRTIEGFAPGSFRLFHERADFYNHNPGQLRADEEGEEEEESGSHTGKIS